MIRRLFMLSAISSALILSGCGRASDVVPGADPGQVEQGRNLQEEQMQKQMQDAQRKMQQGGPRRGR